MPAPSSISSREAHPVEWDKSDRVEEEDEEGAVLNGDAAWRRWARLGEDSWKMRDNGVFTRDITKQKKEKEKEKEKENNEEE